MESGVRSFYILATKLSASNLPSLMYPVRWVASEGLDSGFQTLL